MPYASVDQLKEVIPARDLELLTDFEHSGEPSDTRLQRALVDATAEINGYIAKVVKRPLADLQTRRGSEGRFYAELNWGPRYLATSVEGEFVSGSAFSAVDSNG